MMQTWTPWVRTSIRRAALIDAKAAFELESAPAKGGAMWSPTEPTLMMRPFALRTSGRKAWITAIWPNRLTS